MGNFTSNDWLVLEPDSSCRMFLHFPKTWVMGNLKLRRTGNNKNLDHNIAPKLSKIHVMYLSGCSPSIQVSIHLCVWCVTISSQTCHRHFRVSTHSFHSNVSNAMSSTHSFMVFLSLIYGKIGDGGSYCFTNIAPMAPVAPHWDSQCSHGPTAAGPQGAKIFTGETACRTRWALYLWRTDVERCSVHICIIYIYL